MADGDVAQLGERCPYKAEVVGSSPAVPTRGFPARVMCAGAMGLAGSKIDARLACRIL